MKEQEPADKTVYDKYHRHPGTDAPEKVYSCISCGSMNRIKGQWNTYTGRWLMSFNCQNCDTHQEAFVSEPRNWPKQGRKTRSVVKDD